MQDKIADQIIANQIRLFRITVNEQRKAISILNNLKTELLGRLATSGDLSAMGKAKIKALIKEVDGLIADSYAKIEIDSSAIAEYEASATVSAMQPIGAVAATTPVIKAIGKDLLILGSPASEWWSKQSDDLAFKFAAEVRQGASNGETNYQITNRVKSLFPGAQRAAAALVHTQVQTIAGNARMAVFKENDDILSGIEQLSTLDSHTSVICVSYSGAKWDVNGNPIMGNTLPFNGGTPRHINCRSVIVPIVKSLSELAGKPVQEPLTGTRASEMGPISASTTMSQFLRGKPDAYVDNLLGKGRAQLWRDGKITLKDLVDQRGRPLTLEKLKAMHDG